MPHIQHHNTGDPNVDAHPILLDYVMAVPVADYENGDTHQADEIEAALGHWVYIDEIQNPPSTQRQLELLHDLFHGDPDNSHPGALTRARDFRNTVVLAEYDVPGAHERISYFRIVHGDQLVYALRQFLDGYLSFPVEQVPAVWVREPYFDGEEITEVYYSDIIEALNEEQEFYFQRQMELVFYRLHEDELLYTMLHARKPVRR